LDSRRDDLARPWTVAEGRGERPNVHRFILCQLVQQRGHLQHRGEHGHGGLGVVAGADVQELGDRGRAAPGELDVAVTDLVRLLGRPATDPRTAGKRALT
jgi:hypothetical protein